MALKQHPDHPNLTIISHPLLDAGLTVLRMRDTGSADYASQMRRISSMIVFSVLEDLPTKKVPIETGTGESMSAPVLAEPKIALISVLGAGQGFVDGLRNNLLPNAREGYIAARRDEKTLRPVLSYHRLSDSLHGVLTLILDPMLATGGSASAAIQIMKEDTNANNMRLITLLAAPEGVKRMREDHPDIRVFTVALDNCLNEKGYILPGLGDAGDRFLGIEPI